MNSYSRIQKNYPLQICLNYCSAPQHTHANSEYHIQSSPLFTAMFLRRWHTFRLASKSADCWLQPTMYQVQTYVWQCIFTVANELLLLLLFQENLSICWLVINLPQNWWMVILQGTYINGMHITSIIIGAYQITSVCYKLNVPQYFLF